MPSDCYRVYVCTKFGIVFVLDCGQTDRQTQLNALPTPMKVCKRPATQMNDALCLGGPVINITHLAVFVKEAKVPFAQYYMRINV